jgi:hypothetical protein
VLGDDVEVDVDVEHLVFDVGGGSYTASVTPARRERSSLPLTSPPFSLSEEARGRPEVDAGRLPVRAYVQTREALVRVEGVALLQTPDAVLVRYGDVDGYPFEAWVWRAAVKHRKAPTR